MIIDDPSKEHKHTTIKKEEVLDTVRVPFLFLFFFLQLWLPKKYVNLTAVQKLDHHPSLHLRSNGHGARHDVCRVRPLAGGLVWIRPVEVQCSGDYWRVGAVVHNGALGVLGRQVGEGRTVVVGRVVDSLGIYGMLFLTLVLFCRDDTGANDGGTHTARKPNSGKVDR